MLICRPFALKFMPHCPDYEKHCLKHCPMNPLCAFESQVEVQHIQLHNLTQSDSTWILPLRQLPKTPTKSHLEQTSPPSIAFLPTSRETHSGELSLQSCSLRSPSFWPLHSGSLCSHFQSPACHSGALPLGFHSCPGKLNCLKSYEESWPHVMTPIGSKKRLEFSPHWSPWAWDSFLSVYFLFLFVI